MFSSWKKQLVLPIMIGSTLVAASSIEGADTRKNKGLRRTSRNMNRRLSPKNAACSFFSGDSPYPVPDTSKLGAELFKWTPATTGNSPKSAKAHKIADNGIGSDSFNKYAWSSALDNDGCMYVGTFNINFNLAGLPAFIDQMVANPLDLLKVWSGSPATYSEGGAIYKICGDKVKLVHKAGHDHVGFRKGINYLGDMYFSSANSETGAKIFTNAGSDDDTFTILDNVSVEVGPFPMIDLELQLLPSDLSIRAMCTSSFSDKLYIGTENISDDGPAILSYNANGGIWEQFRIGEGPILAFAECIEITPGFILFGTWEATGFSLYLYDESTLAWSPVANPGDLEPAANGVMQLDIVGDYLYLGTVSFLNGFGYARIPLADIGNITGEAVSLTESPTQSPVISEGPSIPPTPQPSVSPTGSPRPTTDPYWITITTDGFQDEQNTQANVMALNPYPWSTAVVGNRYYIGTFAGVINADNSEYGPLDTRAQLWSTDVTDGTTWRLEEDDAFGEAYSYGFRTMQPGPDGSLYIGTASNLLFMDATRAPYTDYFTGTSDLGNEGICHLIEDFGNRLFFP